MYCTRKIKGNTTSAELIIIFLLVVTIPVMIMTNTHLVYGQPNQSNFNVTDSQNIQNIPAKKVLVGDIEIAYKAFGKGDPILLISGSGNVMDVWPTSFLRELSSNHTVIIFDNRGVGNTSSGAGPFTIDQFANDTVGLLDALNIRKADVFGFSMASIIAQQLTLAHPEKVSRLVLYGASCGGQEAIPQTPEVAGIISDFVNNRTENINEFLSVTFPSEWIKTHPQLS